MIEINKSDIDRISTFIIDNELDYDIIDSGIIRYHIKSYDYIVFYFYNYNDNWIDDFKFDEFWSVDSSDNYNYLVYNNPDVSSNINSPFNILHEVSPINDIQLTKVNKLYFEIHPISCQSGNESYLLKLLCNNEEVLKEFINYIVSKKKGLKLLIDTIFKEIK